MLWYGEIIQKRKLRYIWMACMGINGIVDKNGKNEKKKETIIIVSSEITHEETHQTKEKKHQI